LQTSCELHMNFCLILYKLFINLSLTSQELLMNFKQTI
jgi:hypothetical protein